MLAFRPHVRVHHRQDRPTSILPVDYAWFLVVILPEAITFLPLAAQLAVVKAATFRRRSYPSLGPFGSPIAFEFRQTQSSSIYLNAAANFDSSNEENA